VFEAIIELLVIVAGKKHPSFTPCQKTGMPLEISTAKSINTKKFTL
jgi:hypothetical protein